MATIDDIIKIKTKDETFMAIKLEIPELPGISDKLHLHILRLDIFDRRIIQLKKILEINDKPFTQGKTEWEVMGSKGKKYIVTLTGNGYKCTCKGYMFSKKPKSCSHIVDITKLKV